MAILLRFDVFQQISDTNIASCLKTIKMPLYKAPLRQCLWDLQQTLLRTELKLSDVEIQNRDTIFRPADICKMRNCLESLKLDSVMACYRTCLQFHDHQLAKGVFMQAKAFKVDDSQQFLSNCCRTWSGTSWICVSSERGGLSLAWKHASASAFCLPVASHSPDVDSSHEQRSSFAST